MSALSSSDSPACPSENPPRQPVVAPVHLRVQLAFERAGLSEVVADVTRLAEYFMPEGPYFLAIDGEVMVLRVRHGALRTCRTDTFVCRLARIHGIIHVSAGLKNISGDLVYGAEVRGRSRVARVRL